MSIDATRFNFKVGDFVEGFAAAPFAKTYFAADLIAWREADRRSRAIFGAYRSYRVLMWECFGFTELEGGCMG